MPNLPVDVNSWGRSACYPRSTFYPLSDGPSIRNHRITKTCFRTCSTCRSRSQALLCLYTLRLVSNQPERTFARLRYFLGGDRPSQTAHQTVSLTRITGLQVRFQTNQGGISRLTPPKLASRFQSLPPILHKLARKSVPSCSKGSRGLSVLPRVGGIFTPRSISLSPWPRQWGSRYAIRAGRNLPDKEFRYLRTVIVTAAVYWGFDSLLRRKANRLLLTFQHRAGVRPYTSSYDLAESYVFGKQSLPPGLCNPRSPARSRAIAFTTRGTPSPEVTVPICRVP